MLVALLSFCSYANALMTPSNTFTVLALNSNGFGSSHGLKIQNVNNLILARRPHVFVLSETKTGSKICNDLPNTEYTIHESTGVLRTGQKRGHKWGIAVGVRRDIQILQRVQIQDDAAAGRLVALDIFLPTADGKGISHRFIGCYAPWDPGLDMLSRRFWPLLTKLCTAAPISWTVAGDLNATLRVCERASLQKDGRPQLIQFLNDAKGQDLWMQTHTDLRRDWTCRKIDSGGSMVDRVLTYAPYLIDADIMVAAEKNEFIPSDHRPIFARIVTSNPNKHETSLDMDPTVALLPRIKYPAKKDKHLFETYRDVTNKKIIKAGYAQKPITDDRSFLERYNGLTAIINETALAVFG
jgi:hypothetical protein